MRLLQICNYRKSRYPWGSNRSRIFDVLVILCRRLENVERKVVYTIRGKCSVYYASRVRCFFEKSFRVPKVVPKVN